MSAHGPAVQVSVGAGEDDGRDSGDPRRLRGVGWLKRSPPAPNTHRRLPPVAVTPSTSCPQVPELSTGGCFPQPQSYPQPSRNRLASSCVATNRMEASGAEAGGPGTRPATDGMPMTRRECLDHGIGPRTEASRGSNGVRSPARRRGEALRAPGASPCPRAEKAGASRQAHIATPKSPRRAAPTRRPMMIERPATMWHASTHRTVARGLRSRRRAGSRLLR